MSLPRRGVLKLFVIGVAGLAAGCDTSVFGECDPSLPGADCEPIAAEPGLNQFDMLELVHNGVPPSDRRFAFAVWRDGQFVEPDPSEFTVGPAPEGTADDRSYNSGATELYTFKEGETVVFYEVFDS